MEFSGLLTRVAALLGLMAVVTLIELLIPLRRRAWAGRWLPNLGLTIIFMAMNVVLTVAMVVASLQLDATTPGLFRTVGLGGVTAILAGVLVLDFSAYLAHVLMHKVPLLWRIHRVHHSDASVDVTTTFRQHPAETLIRFLFTAAPALLLGVPVVAVALYRMASGVNAVFEHANIRVWAPLDRTLRLVVVTPHMHKVHHSRRQRETDSNYGNILSLFDRVFTTYNATTAAPQLVYGLDDAASSSTLPDLIAMPWKYVPRPPLVAASAK